MAAPVYGTDLTTVNLAEATTGWAAWGGGGAGLSASPDLALEGTNCVDKQISNSEKGQFHDNGSGWAPTATDHFYIWLFCATPGLINTKANRGVMACLGTTTANFVKFHLTGSDTFDNTEVAKCWPIRYRNDALTGVRTLAGTPGTDPQVVGGGLFTTATVKGANLGVDGMRQGSGFYITAGDSGDPAQFAGAASTDATNSYGITQDLGGSFQQQGVFVIGQNNSGTPTAAYYSESGISVFFTDTEHSLGDFSQILADHADTTFILTNATIEGLGTNNPGRFKSLDTGVAMTLTNVGFTSIGPTNLNSGVTADTCRWISSAIVDPTNADYGGFQTLDGTGDYLDTSAAVSNTFANGDFEIIWRGHADDWSTAAQQTIFHWDEAGNDSIMWYINSSDDLALDVEAGGVTTTVSDTTILDSLTNGENYWLRVFWDASAGRADFYYSEDPGDVNARSVSWTAGASPTGISRTITTLNGVATIGGDSAGANLWTGDVAYCSIWDGATTAELQVMLADWRWGPDFTGVPPARADGIQSVNWEENGDPVYTLGDDNTGAATMTDSAVITSSSHAGLLWDVNTDPNGELDGMTFEASGNHAIEFGKNSPASVALTDQTYTGYNVANGNADSTFYNNTGGALTINVSGAAGNTTYRNGVGASTTVSSSVTVTVNVADKDGNAIESVAVRVEETDGTLISQGNTNASGVYSFSYTGSTPQATNIKARLKGWLQQQTTGTIVGGTGMTTNFTLSPDTVVALP